MDPIIIILETFGLLGQHDFVDVALHARQFLLYLRFLLLKLSNEAALALGVAVELSVLCDALVE